MNSGRAKQKKKSKAEAVNNYTKVGHSPVSKNRKTPKNNDLQFFVEDDVV